MRRIGAPLVLPAAGLTFLIAVGSAIRGLLLLFDSIGLDQSSPLGTLQAWILGLGLAAAVVVTTVLTVAVVKLGGSFWIIVTAFIGLALCTVPLYCRDTTIDVTRTGFHRAHYRFDSRDFRIYNGTGGPITVCVGTNGRCAADADALRAPGRRIGPGEVARIDWPTGRTGDLTLTIVRPPASMSRPGTRLTIDEPPKSDNDPPDYQPPPFQPPPPIPGYPIPLR
ncbi:hypothetical protein [Cryptosporangium sp. NPDC051539]|uniref:hypothetical protein n=1 Tax=Cryptosporangium sp. NPDC051539 TaxID=3363962 RepID=UPI00379AA6D7